jgi:hypothetical protein
MLEHYFWLLEFKLVFELTCLNAFWKRIKIKTLFLSARPVILSLLEALRLFLVARAFPPWPSSRPSSARLHLPPPLSRCRVGPGGRPQLGVDIEPARLVISSAHYGSARYGSARYGSLRYRAESLARLGSFKSSSQLVSSWANSFKIWPNHHILKYTIT